MWSCPSDQTLTGLLADALTQAERDRLARHLAGCASCQEKLARRTEPPDAVMWRRVGQPPQGCQAEDRMVRRLQQIPPSPGAHRLEQADPATVHWDPAADLTPGAVVFELPTVPGYEIQGVLGRGGMGIVYQARQVALQRTVALKMVLNGAHAGPTELGRFRAEAAVIARLQHPNIVQIYDVGEVAGRPYFVLEFVAGGSLAQYLHGKPQPMRPAATLIETLARAIHAAHVSGVVHRDLKPENILLTEVRSQEPEARDQETAFLTPDSCPLTPVPKIADFGLAKCVAGDGEAPGQRSSTVTEELLEPVIDLCAADRSC
jgi:serine/threonine protein kinase